MQPEHESAVAAWLDDISTKREIDIVKQRFEGIDAYHAALFALTVEILVAMNLYGEPEIIITDTDIGKSGGTDDDDTEPWKGDNDATGWKP